MAEPEHAESSEELEGSTGDSEPPLSVLFGSVRTVVEAVMRPLRRSDGPNKFDLSAAETATTTYEGDVGWGNRPAAVLECPNCTSDILQHNSHDAIDCPRCVAEYDYDEFADLELLHLGCPRCGSQMMHGQRHPGKFDIPEWATCDECRYHWEYKHAYDRPTDVERTDVR